VKKNLYQKKKKKVLKLNEISRKVAFFLFKTGQTDRRHYDDKTHRQNLPRGKNEIQNENNQIFYNIY
jgi:hypothetical protein